jgi:hypothetical protein
MELVQAGGFKNRSGLTRASRAIKHGRRLSSQYVFFADLSGKLNAKSA